MHQGSRANTNVTASGAIASAPGEIEVAVGNTNVAVGRISSYASSYNGFESVTLASEAGYASSCSGSSTSGEEQSKDIGQLPTAEELAMILKCLNPESSSTLNDQQPQQGILIAMGSGYDFGYQDDMMIRHQLATIRQIQTWIRLAARGTASLTTDSTNLFLSDFANVGGVSTLLQFLESHINDPTSCVTCLSCLTDILEISQSFEDQQDEGEEEEEKKEGHNDEWDSDDEDNTTAYGSTSKRLIQLTIKNEGVEIMLKAFEIHSSSIIKWMNESSSSASQLSPRKTKLPSLSLWKPFSKSLSTSSNNNPNVSSKDKSACHNGSNNDLKSRSVGEFDYDYVSVGLSDLDFTIDDDDDVDFIGDDFQHCGKKSSKAATTATARKKQVEYEASAKMTKRDQFVIEDDAVYTSYDASIRVAEGLAVVLPSSDVSKAGSILHFFIVIVPKLLRSILKTKSPPKSGVTGNQQPGSLILSIVSCLVAGTDVEGIEKVVDLTQLVLMTVQIMRVYPSLPAVNIGGCIILEELAPLISEDSRRRCGVYQVLDDLVNCLDMDMVDVKRVAGEILKQLS